jgi:hypothetical protein
MNKKLLVAVVSSWAVSGVLALADSSFGPLPAATFNPTGANSGNPNSLVEVTTVNGILGDTVTLGLAAQQRYDNPALTANNGTYFATPGANLKGTPATLGALWNVDFYVNVAGGQGNVGNYTFKLFYDFDPAAGTPKTQLGVLNLNAANFATGGSLTASTIQDSQNLDFGFFATSIPGIVTPPTGVTSFDPNAIGEYSFILEVDQDGRKLGESDITVDVNNVPDVSATAPLLGLALGGLGMFASRKRK